MTELRFRVEKYINSEEVFQAIDDMDLLDLEAVTKTKVDQNLAQLEPNWAQRRGQPTEREMPKKGLDTIIDLLLPLEPDPRQTNIKLTCP